MYFQDLAPCTYGMHKKKPRANVLAVGWLEKGNPYAKGNAPEAFVEKLHRLCSEPVNRMRGLHWCEFCDARRIEGNGEIQVIDSRERVFQAPQLIGHYVTAHRYLPPAEFIAAVLEAEELGPQPDSELNQAMKTLCNEPTSANRELFYAAFLRGDVGSQECSNGDDAIPGRLRPYDLSDLKSRLGEDKRGQPVLCLEADVTYAALRVPATVFTVVGDVRDLLIRVRELNASLLVLSFEFLWKVYIPAEDVSHLLALQSLLARIDRLRL